MTKADNVVLGVSEAERHERKAEQPSEFELLGLRWDLLPEVFAPYHSRSTESYTTWLPYPQGGNFLEMGCGAGVTAVYAALHGCAAVTAADISAASVENARVNAVRHGVGDRFRAVRGDMFGALGADERFDLIFWNSSAIEAPADFTYSREIDWAIFDRGYASHRAYLLEGSRRLTENGRLFLGFNTNGNFGELSRIAAEAGLRIEERESMTTTYNESTTATFRLLELLPV